MTVISTSTISNTCPNRMGSPNQYSSTTIADLFPIFLSKTQIHWLHQLRTQCRMAQKGEKEEAELTVPETLTLCTPPSNNSGSGEVRSAVCASDDGIVDVRPTSASSPENPCACKRSRAEEVDSSGDNQMKRRKVNRCSCCSKKVGLMAFRCRCGQMFCSEHRYSDRHDCSYDYKAVGRDAIARENPMVRAAKILKV